MRTSLLLAAVVLFAACGKESTSSSVAVTPAAGGSSTRSGSSQVSLSSLARNSGPTYSQSVTVADANAMIGSYLASVHYPDQDSALRSLTFDADTLRHYLEDTSIKTLRFFMAHRPAWAVSADYGKYSGYKPNAMTLVIVGMTEDDKYVLNDRGQVYEHCSPCPFNCPSATNSALIQ